MVFNFFKTKELKDKMDKIEQLGVDKVKSIVLR